MGPVLGIAPSSAANGGSLCCTGCCMWVSAVVAELLSSVQEGNVG